MKFSILLSLLSLAYLSIASDNKKRGVKVIKVTKTVDKTVTNTHVVDAATSTVIDWSTLTSTSTTTRYTSTFTSTIFGDVYTYLSVYSSVVAATGTEATQSPADTSEKETEFTTQTLESETTQTLAETSNFTADQEAEKTTQIETLDPVTTQIPAETSSFTTEKEAEATTSLQTLDPATTTSSAWTSTSVMTTSTIDKSQVTSFPSVWDGFTLAESLTHVVSGLICIVDFDYYSEGTETITSTQTLYLTVST